MAVHGLFEDQGSETLAMVMDYGGRSIAEANVPGLYTDRGIQ